MTMTNSKQNREPMPQQDSPETLAAAVALGQLRPHTAQAMLAAQFADNAEASLERELAQATFETELASYQHVTTALASLSEPIAPPARLKASLLAEITRLPQSATTHDEEALSTPVTEITSARGYRTGKRKTRGGNGNTGSARVVVAIGAVAAAAACVFGGVVLDRTVLLDGNVEAGQQPNEGPGAPTTPAPSPTQTTQPDPTAATDAQRGFVSLAAASDLQRVSTPVAGGGEATLIWSSSKGSAAFVGYDLTQVSADEVLAFWFVRDGEMVPAGTAPVDSEGRTWAVLVGPMQEGDGFGVTVEPKGATPSVETPPLLVVES